MVRKINLSFAHGFVQFGTRAGHDDFGSITSFRLEHFGNLGPQTSHGHSANHGATHDTIVAGSFSFSTAGRNEQKSD
jgi:hypothetical protein